MFCAACRKRVVFGSIRGAAWDKVHAGDWLLGGRPPNPGVLGDCPACGVRLEWEAGEEREPALANVPARVHLSALRESPQAWRGRVALRALVVEINERAGGERVEGGPPGGRMADQGRIEGVCIASDSWRNRGRGGSAEDDAAMIERLLREQVPRIAVAWATVESAERFRETGRVLDGGSRAAWVEMEGSFEPGEGGGIVSVTVVTSIWPPRD